MMAETNDTMWRSHAKVHIRWMIRRDMPEVLEIEREAFEHPWVEEDFLDALRNRKTIGMVAEHGEKVVGFMVYELYNSRLQVLNIACARQWRRLDVGSQMVAKLIGKLSSHRRTAIGLEVRESNLAAQLFFRAQGFVATAVLRDHFADSGEDAIAMRFRLGED